MNVEPKTPEPWLIGSDMPATRIASPLASDSSFEQLAVHVREVAGNRPIHYFPSPGNWGDSLINAGARDFFDRHNITVESLQRAEIEGISLETAATRVAIVGGGGGWNHNWRSSVDFTQRLSAMYSHVVVLPSSYDPRAMEAFPLENVSLVARGRQASAPVADLFCHDMAFCADYTVPAQPVLPYPLISLRRDKERSAEAISSDRNWDISLLGDAATPHYEFLSIISRFASVYTDRLHIAIAAAILGLEVTLLDGNYGKNMELFEYSLRDSFPNVRLVGWGAVDWSALTGVVPIGISGY